MNARGHHIAIAGMALLMFSTPSPAPQVPDASKEKAAADQAPDAAASLLTLTKLSEAQTEAINALHARLIAIDKRVLALEKKKEKDNG